MAEKPEKFKFQFLKFDDKRREFLRSSAGTGGGSLSSGRLMILEDFLHISSVRRNNPLPLFRLQISLLQDLLISEKAIAENKKRREERQNEIVTNPSNKEKLEEEIKVIEQETFPYKADCRAIRDISDGIAWRLFDYDRAVLTEIANRPGTKHINIEGLEAEMHEFGRVFKSEEGIAIFNDLTNFLKLGDVTIRKNEGTFEFIEVKTGHKTSNRITRQRQGLRRAVTFFNTGERNDEEGTSVISELDVRPETYHNVISAIIRRAEKNGAAVEKIGDHLIVECADFTKLKEIPIEAMKAITEGSRSWVEGWKKQNDFFLWCFFHERQAYIRNYAPLSIFPLSEPSRIKLMTNALMLNCCVNYSEVLRYFERRGWRILTSPMDPTGEVELEKMPSGPFATITKGRLIIEVAWSMMGQLGFEFFKPRTLVDIFESMLATGQTPIEFKHISLKGEPEIWD